MSNVICMYTSCNKNKYSKIKTKVRSQNIKKKYCINKIRERVNLSRVRTCLVRARSSSSKCSVMLGHYWLCSNMIRHAWKCSSTLGHTLSCSRMLQTHCLRP